LGQNAHLEPRLLLNDGDGNFVDQTAVSGIHDTGPYTALFEPTAQIEAVTADLSALGGPAAMALVDAGNGSYTLESTFAVTSPRGTGRSMY
jgi:hypothetical protein